MSALVASTLVVSSAQAFDEDRKGFILGLGAGISAINTEVTVDNDGYHDNASDSSVGFSTSLKIGYGFTDQFALYYVRNAAWFGYDHNDDNFISGISGVAANYYIAPKSPIYVMAGVGFGDFANFSEGEGEVGSAFMLGGGYEVYPHVQVEGSYIVTDIEESGLDFSTDAFHLTVNYLWY